MFSKMNDTNVAIFAKDLCFSYKKSGKILNEINLNVNKANIYGLLGPSGCGKTTLLKCILGRLKPSKGDIRIFGFKPGSQECHIPGAGVGYMPQEFGLCSVFTVEEIVTYFGKIYSMNKIEIKEKFTEIIKLLDLPQNDKLIDQFSGGQKRRISLACALIHSPPLLILDEPTVGTDPLLRETIWLHLRSLCDRGVTVILTTHYTEEASNANVVAFMRSGQILAEDEPNILINKYASTNLEEVFLKLCHSGENLKNNNSFEVQNKCYENQLMKELNKEKDVSSETTNKVSFNNDICINVENPVNNNKAFNYNKPNETDVKPLRKTRLINKISALTLKNLHRLSRYWIQFIFFIIFPALEFALLLYSVGDGPTGLKIAVYDEEVNNNVTNTWGQIFTQSIDNKVFKIIEFDTFEKAMDSVKSGQTYAVIDINERFSKALRLRAIYGSETEEGILEESQIRVHIDWTNQLVGFQIERYLYEAIIRFGEEVANRSNTNPESLKIPLTFEEPVYGIRIDSLRDFILPSTIIIVFFYGITMVSSNLILEEQKDGIIERSLVAGVTAIDFLISHALTQFLILCFQLIFILLIPFFVFNTPMSGSFILIIVLVLSQGICGVVFGLMVAILCNELLYTAMFILASFISSMVLSGVFWPIENMPYILQFCGHFSPNTLPIHSLRYILYREWNLTYYEVYMGFVVTYVWFSIFLIIALIFLRKI